MIKNTTLLYFYVIKHTVQNLFEDTKFHRPFDSIQLIAVLREIYY